MVINEVKLAGVKRPMVDVVMLAASYLDFPIKVNEGVRTLARQVLLVKSGASQTVDSRHLTGHAVDLLPCVDIDKDGKIEVEELYSWQLIFVMTKAMRRAALDLNVVLVWGGCWDRVLNAIDDPETENAKYILRKKASNKKPFSDGPHFQLDRKAYPK